MSSTELVVDSKDIEFALKEWLKVESLSKFPKYADFDEETMDLLVKEGHNFAVEVINPTQAEADREGCKVVDGRAKVPSCLQEPYKQAYELGWASLNSDPEYGGQGAPWVVGIAVKEAMIGANVGLSMYFGLTEGAAGLVETFGTDELKEKYLPRMINGEFTGTMCLSEPHAGSDVGAGSTIAEPQGDGSYKIKGTKCWISSGDNDLSSNVIHAVLARIKGAPAGTKGLSLFLVPAYRLNDDQTVGEENDVTLASIEHKMGINCSVTAVLNFGENDNCLGYLLGEENSGMAHMFQMMNEARMGVAAIGLAVASAAYQNSLAYAKERVQGAHINNIRDASAPRVSIIEHPDVRLTLMGMKARVEAMRALVYATTKFWDVSLASEDDAEKKSADDLVQILTPMCKGWACEVGIDVVRMGIQVLGGVGYTKDFPLEQYYRDLRIAAIYEGTTGIQALDLVGRKMTARNGALFMKLLGHFNELAESHKSHPMLGETIQKWATSCEAMADAAMTLQSMLSERGMAGAALYATPFLMNISSLTAGCFLLEQAVLAADNLDALKQEHKATDENYDAFLEENSDASFYDTKVKTAKFYVDVVLPYFEAAIDPIKTKSYDALDVKL